MTPIAKSNATSIIQANSDKIKIYYNECRSTSHRLADDLMSHGHKAQVLRCSGLHTNAPDADKRWQSVGGQALWVHYVVEFGDEIVDLTRRQFFPGCASPFYQPFAEFAAEWQSFGPALENPRFHAAQGRL